jgi:hypothetical protein
VDVDPFGDLLHRDLLHQRLQGGEQPVTMNTGGAVEAALADVGAEAICRAHGGRVVDGEDVHADVVRRGMVAAGNDDDGVTVSSWQLLWWTRAPSRVCWHCGKLPNTLRVWCW